MSLESYDRGYYNGIQAIRGVVLKNMAKENSTKWDRKSKTQLLDEIDFMLDKAKKQTKGE